MGFTNTDYLEFNNSLNSINGTAMKNRNLSYMIIL